MPVDILEAEVLSGWRLRVLFDDGVSGIVDIHELVPFEGVFAPLKDPSFFSQATIDAELGTVVWPNGADLDPDVLRRIVAGESLDQARGIAS